MKIVFSLLQLAFSLFALKYVRDNLVSGRSSLLAVHIFVFVVFNSLGVALGPFFPGERLSFITSANTISFLRIVEPSIYLRQCLSHWIFLFIAIAGMRWQREWPLIIRGERGRILSQMSWGYIVFFVGVLLTLRYYIYGPGWTILRETRLAFLSTSEAIAQRTHSYLAAGFGQGNYLASVAAYLFFPLAAALLLYKNGLINKVIFYCSGIFSLAYAYQTSQKAPFLWTLLTYVILFYLSRKKSMRIKGLRLIFLAAAFVGSLGSIVLYMVNFGHSLQSATERFCTVCSWCLPQVRRIISLFFPTALGSGE